MKKIGLLVLLFFTISAFTLPDDSLKEGFITGNPEIKSVNSLAFGPEGILFIGDSQRGEIIALDTKDITSKDAPKTIDMKKVDVTIAAMLGTNPDAVSIQDMAVNPLSKMIYVAVQLADGTPVILRTAGDKFENVSLKSVSYSKIALEKVVKEDAKDQRGRPLRMWTISDLSYYKGQVMVSGLSNEEFSSTFRSIPFPFKDKQMHASLEMYHAAHGQYETHSPIKTFMPYEIGGKDYLVASYTCTPLVIFPMDELKAGQHVKGKTVAELGNRNTPLDIVSVDVDGKAYILLANSSRALMKIDPAKIAEYKAYLTEPVKESSATAGVDFIALPYVHIQQMDKLSKEQVLVLQRNDKGDLNLMTIDSNRL